MVRYQGLKARIDSSRFIFPKFAQHQIKHVFASIPGPINNTLRVDKYFNDCDDESLATDGMSTTRHDIN
jgi:hypothetical protein